MPSPTAIGIERIRSLLAELFDLDSSSIESRRGEHATAWTLTFGRTKLAIEIRRDATTASVVDGARRAREAAQRLGRGTIPLVVVPYAGDAARIAASREAASLLDRAGNAWIKGGSVFIRVEGRPDPAPSRGRPRDAFAPRARRLVATLIAHPERTFTQREVALESGLDEGRTSRIVRRLIDDGFVERDRDRRLRLVRRDLLIDSYRDSRPFDREDLRTFSVAARSNEALVRAARDLLDSERIAYAATGLLAAHAYTGRGTAKLATFYVDSTPGDGALALAGFRADESRGNVVLVIPRDARVLERAIEVGGMRCAPVLDVYADLASHKGTETQLAVDLRLLV